MKQHTKSFLMVILAITFGAMLSLGVFFATQKSTKAMAEFTKQEISVSGLQMRGAFNGWYYYLVIQSDAYDGLSALESIEESTVTYNTTLDKITLYTSAEDVTGTKLSVLTVKHIDRNFSNWTNGLFIQFAEYDTTLGGHQVYKVVIEKGCELIADKDSEKIFVVDKEYTFINASYGDKSQKLSSFVWYAPGEETEISSVSIRSDELGKYIVLQSDVYSGLTETTTGTLTADELTTASKIKVHTSQEDVTGTTLALDAYKFDSNGLYLKYTNDSDFETYNGKTIYKIAIDLGCKLPYTDKNYISTEDKWFINNDYGKDSAKDNATNFVETEVTYYANVSNVAVISSGNSGNGGTENFIVLQSKVFGSSLSGSATATTIDLKVYLSENDAEPKKLVGTWWEYNYDYCRFGVQGLFLAYNSASDFSTYNGATIYKITIGEGSELPVGDKKYYTTKEMSFINREYGNTEVTNKATSWRLDMPSENTEVSGVQVRGYGDGTKEYIVLQNAGFADVDADTAVNDITLYNTLSKVKVYLSKEDATGTYLSEFCKTTDWTINLWASSGLMIPIDTEKYATYNPKSIYRIVIEEGSEMPSTEIIYVTDKEASYLNKGYNKDSTTNEALNWWDESIELKSFGTAVLTTMDNRARTTDPAEERWLILYFNKDFETQLDAESWIDQLNTLDYINIYLSKNAEPIKLREIYYSSITMKGFGYAAALNINIINDPKYDGPHMYSVEVLEGCQFPYMKDGEQGYVTTATSITFVNRDYGKTGEIFGLYDSDGSARTYELWSVAWPALRKVTFKVEGADKTYDSILVAAGDMINYSDYAIEGYDLSISDEDGNEGSGGAFTMPDKNVTLTLTYTKKGSKSDNSSSGGCSGCNSAIGGSISLLLIAMLSCAIVIVLRGKTKRGQK